MVTQTPEKFKPSEFGHYPLHWYTHLMHGAEIIGYRHPDPEVREDWLWVYVAMVKALHLTPETREQMAARMAEDRIENDSVVSGG